MTKIDFKERIKPEYSPLQSVKINEQMRDIQELSPEDFIAEINRITKKLKDQGGEKILFETIHYEEYSEIQAQAHRKPTKEELDEDYLRYKNSHFHTVKDEYLRCVYFLEKFLSGTKKDLDKEQKSADHKTALVSQFPDKKYGDKLPQLQERISVLNKIISDATTALKDLQNSTNDLDPELNKRVKNLEIWSMTQYVPQNYHVSFE